MATIDKELLLFKIDSLCAERNITRTTAFLESGVGKNFKSNLSSANPSLGKLTMLANYFNVSVEYLKGETEERENKKTPDIESSAIILNQNAVRMIPLYESVSAGLGAYADNTVVDYVPCYIQSDSEAAETICVKVQGNSMAPKIEDGDIVQVHRQASVDSGTIAVVLLDGEDGLVKKVVYGDNWIELISLNPNYPPMRFEGTDVLKVSIVGKVKKIIKNI